MSSRARWPIALALLAAVALSLTARSATPAFFPDDPLQVDNDRALDAGDEDEPALASPRSVGGVVALDVVQGERERLITERDRVLDQVACGVPDAVGAIVDGVSVKFYFEHWRRARIQPSYYRRHPGRTPGT